MAALASKRISQKTFDECVRENIEELEMEKDEAVSDAITQFKSQGVDLTNIDTSGEDREDQQRATAAAIELLRDAVTTKDGTPDEAKCRVALLDLAAACRSCDQASGGSGGGGGGEGGGAKGEGAVEGSSFSSAGGDNDDLVDADEFASAGLSSSGGDEEKKEEGVEEGGSPSSSPSSSSSSSTSSSSAVSAAAANQTAIAMANGPTMLAALLGFEPLVGETLECLKVVCLKSVEGRDAFPAQGMAVLAKILQVQAELGGGGATKEEGADDGSSSSSSSPSSSPLEVATKACNVVFVLTHKTENNKQGFVRKESGGLDALLACLTTFGDNGPELVRAACVALRSVCTFDDLRKDFAGAFDAAKAAVKAGFVIELLRLGKIHGDDPDCVAAVFFALRAVACNDEAVQQISAGGGRRKNDDADDEE